MVNWTEADLRSFEKRSGVKSARKGSTQKKDTALYELGAWVSIEFEIAIHMPSFKNSKQLFVRGGRPGMATKAAYAKSMKAAIVEIQSKRLTRAPLTNATYFFRFLISQKTHMRQDNDGAEAALLDCLRDAGILADDNRNHIVRCDGHDWKLVDRGNEGFLVRLSGQECIAVKKAA